MAWYAKCRSCDGIGKKWIERRHGTEAVECRACGGSGSNHKLWVSNCARCYCEITYPVGSAHPPTHCRNCKEQMRAEKQAQWREKYCSGCGTTIKYRIDWDKIPDLCSSCKEKRRRERDEQKAKWREKSCSKCGAIIKYNVDWNKIPDLCKSCIEKVKTERAEAKAKWIHKSCGNCGTDFTYHKDTPADRIPKYCKPCREKARAPRELASNENARFRDACRRAGMTGQECRVFSDKSYHQIPEQERLRMTIDEIEALARDWLNDNRGKFRREDQRR